MATNPRKRQKQLARRTAKRKAKQKASSRQRDLGIAARLELAARAPILHCWMDSEIWANGIGQVLVSRQLPNREIAFGIFLVDVYCLGVKDAFANIVSPDQYREQINGPFRRDYELIDLEPACARKLVEDAIAYARELGLQPHPDYRKARPIFGTIDPAACTEDFTFGKDGMPFFVAGPYDTPQKCCRIIATLENHCGRDGFHHVIPLTEGAAICSGSVDQ